jgi:tripartite-type tricarboxylate transporter receptor subunit TctC
VRHPGTRLPEGALRGYAAAAWFGIGTPTDTPREVIDMLNAEINRALADPKMRERLAELAARRKTSTGSSPPRPRSGRRS